MDLVYDLWKSTGSKTYKPTEPVEPVLTKPLLFGSQSNSAFTSWRWIYRYGFLFGMILRGIQSCLFVFNFFPVKNNIRFPINQYAFERAKMYQCSCLLLSSPPGETKEDNVKVWLKCYVTLRDRHTDIWTERRVSWNIISDVT